MFSSVMTKLNSAATLGQSSRQLAAAAESE